MLPFNCATDFMLWIHIYSEQNGKTLGWSGAWDTCCQRNGHECVNRPEIFVFPHKIAPSQKCSVTSMVPSYLLCHPGFFLSPFPDSPISRKSLSLFCVSFRVSHICSSLSSHATTNLCHDWAAALVSFTLSCSLVPSAQYTTPRSVSLKQGFMLGHQPSVVPHHLEWSLTSEPDPQGPLMWFTVLCLWT